MTLSPVRVWLALAAGAARAGVSATASSVPSAAPTSAAPTSAAGEDRSAAAEAQATLTALAILSAVALIALLVVALAFAAVALALFVPRRRARSSAQASRESTHALMLARSDAGGARLASESRPQRRGEAESLPSYDAATRSDTVCAATTRSPMATERVVAARRQPPCPPTPPTHAPNAFARIFRRAQKRTASEEGWTKAWGLRPSVRLAPTSGDGYSAEEAPRARAKRSGPGPGRAFDAAARASRCPPSVDFRSAKRHAEPVPPPAAGGARPESGLESGPGAVGTAALPDMVRRFRNEGGGVTGAAAALPPPAAAEGQETEDDGAKAERLKKELRLSRQVICL
jgi:hypothetical protein